MYVYTLFVHSWVRNLILLLLISVIIVSLHGLIYNRQFIKTDKYLLTLLTSFSHLQLTLGLILYFISPMVIFNINSLKFPILRYWIIEHNMMMILAIIFISVPGLTVRKLSDDRQKHRRTFIWTFLSLILITSAILMSQRPFIKMPF